MQANGALGSPFAVVSTSLTDMTSTHIIAAEMYSEAGGFSRSPSGMPTTSWRWMQMEIYAPAAGTVIDAANDLPKNSYEEGRVIEPSIPDGVDPIGLGNHVTIDHGDGEFSILLHMKPGSMTVKKGDRCPRERELVPSVFLETRSFPTFITWSWTERTSERAVGCPRTLAGLSDYWYEVRERPTRTGRFGRHP